jgi:hypothetical protein
MAQLTQNQVDGMFQQSELKRNATPLEYNQYSTKSLSDLHPESISKSYGALNKDVSITDYLKYNGRDSSPQARTALAQQYGISNSGTAEGNTALLKALQGGSTQSATSPVNASQGSISGATSPIYTPRTQGNVSQPTETPQSQPDNTQGSISTAANTQATVPQSTYQSNPALDTIQKEYTGYQKQLSDITASIENEFQQKKAQVIASGGIVNEAQIRGLVQAEKAPLIEERNRLLNLQSTTGKTLQSLLGQDKSNRAEADRQQSLEQKNQNENLNRGLNASKFTQTEADKQDNLDIRKQQIKIQEQRLIQSGYKKISDYSDGSKVGEHYVNLNGKKITLDKQTGQERFVGTGSVVGSKTSQSSGTVHSISKGKITYKDFASVPDAPTLENSNTLYPGTMGKTYGAVYQDSVSYAETGKYQKTSQSSKPSSKAYDNAVKQKAANIAQSLGMTEDELRVSYAANKTAVSKLITQKATVSAFENRAKSQIDIILNGYINPRTGEKVSSLNDSVPRSDYKLVNGFYVNGKILAGDTKAQLLSNALITFSAEFTKIMSGGTGSAQASSDSARAEAAKLIGVGLSNGTLNEALGLLQKEMETTTDGQDKQIKETMSNFIGGQSQDKKTPTVVEPKDIPTGYYQASDGLLYKK